MIWIGGVTNDENDCHYGPVQTMRIAIFNFKVIEAKEEKKEMNVSCHRDLNEYRLMNLRSG